MIEIKRIPEEGQLPGWLDRAVRLWPGGNALVMGADRLTFADLASRTAALERRMAACTGPLALSADSRLQLAVGIHSALRQHKAVLPLDPAGSSTDRSRLMAECGIARVFDCTEEVGQPLSAAPVSSAPHPDSIALLLPSSGSGGVPRVAMLSQANLAAAVLASARRLPLRPGDLWLNCLSLGHVAGLSVLLRSLQAGAGVLLHEAFDADALWRDLQRHPVTHLSLVPAMLHRLLQVAGEQPPPPRLRVLLVGGAALAPSLARRAQAAGWPLCVTYGMSETCSQVATLCGSGAGLGPGLVGSPLEGFELRIADPDPSGVGRIQLRGPAVMAGYARPGLRPGLGLENGWLVTGDLGRLRDDGVLQVLGRADDLLVSGGEQVHPAEVEPLLQNCPGIGQAALSACADPVWGDLLVAVYTGEAPGEAVEAFCRERFTGACRPRRFLHLHELPLGGSGKLDRRGLRQRVEAEFQTLSGSSPSPGVSGRTT